MSPPESERVEAELVAEVLVVDLDGEGGLRVAEAAGGAAHGAVGEHEVAEEAHRRRRVERERPEGAQDDVGPQVGEGADVVPGLELPGEQPSAGVQRGADADAGAVADAAGEEALGALEAHVDGAADAQGQDGRDVLEVVHAGAEAAADGRADDADPGRLDVEPGRELAAQLEGGGRALVDREAAARVGLHEAGVGLERRGLDGGGGKDVFDDVGGRQEGRIDVALLPGDGVEGQREVAAGGERAVEVEHGRQRLPIDLYGQGCGSGGGGGLGDDGGDGRAVEQRLLEEHGPEREAAVVERLARDGPGGGVSRGDDGEHAGQSEGRVGPERADAGAGVRRADRGAVAHAGDGEVRGVAGAPRCLAEAVHERLGAADGAGHGSISSRSAARPAAAPS